MTDRFEIIEMREVEKGLEVEGQTLTQTEEEKARELVQNACIETAADVLNFGAPLQKKMADFSEKTLGNVKNRELGEIGSAVSALVGRLKNLDSSEPKSGAYLLKKGRSRIHSLKSRYTKAEKSVEEVCQTLRQHQARLFMDVAMLEEMYSQNLENISELNSYIIAGKLKLNQMSEQGTDEGICDLLEKKAHDLILTRAVALQTAPQIRLVQSADTMMIQKIQSTLNNTVPLWKSRMVIALGLNNSALAIETGRKISDFTDSLLLANATRLKSVATSASLEAERSFIDVETLRKTNNLLIETFEEMAKIQQQGREKRIEAEKEISKIEDQLRQSLLQMKGQA